MRSCHFVAGFALCTQLATGLAQAAPTGCPPAQRIADGVYLLRGVAGASSPENGGQVVNRVFLEGTDGVVVVDPGPSPAAGRDLACTVSRQLGKPISALINTHPHPENVLANAAFPGLPIHASALAAKAMSGRCTECRRIFRARIGTAKADEDDAAELAALMPTQLVDAAQSLTLAGRRLTLLPLGAAHSPGDLAVFDEASGVLIGGDLVNAEPLVDLHDGNTQAALDAVERLAALPGIRQVIPGRGAPFAPAGLARQADYLRTLWRTVQARADSPDGFVPPADLPPELLAFSSDRERQLLNFQHALREAETLWWEKPGKP